MRYSVFVTGAQGNGSYFAVGFSIDELNRLLFAYDNAEEYVFIEGEKISLKNLSKIAIYTFEKYADKESFLNSEEVKVFYTPISFSEHTIGWSYKSDNFLKLAGKNITSEFIKGDYGEKKTLWQVQLIYLHIV